MRRLRRDVEGMLEHVRRDRGRSCFQSSSGAELFRMVASALPSKLVVGSSFYRGISHRSHIACSISKQESEKKQVGGGKEGQLSEVREKVPAVKVEVEI